MMFTDIVVRKTLLFSVINNETWFQNAFKAGISFGKDDMIIPEEKVKMMRKLIP